MSIAIFTFMLIFLYPRYASGEVDAVLFQATLIVMGLVDVLDGLRVVLLLTVPRCDRMDEAERARYASRADRLWMIGYALLFLARAWSWHGRAARRRPRSGSLLWLIYALFAMRAFPRVRAR